MAVNNCVISKPKKLAENSPDFSGGSPDGGGCSVGAAESSLAAITEGPPSSVGWLDICGSFLVMGDGCDTAVRFVGNDH